MFTDDGRTDGRDGRTDDGRRTTYHLSQDSALDYSNVWPTTEAFIRGNSLKEASEWVSEWCFILFIIYILQGIYLFKKFEPKRIIFVIVAKHWKWPREEDVRKSVNQKKSFPLLPILFFQSAQKVIVLWRITHASFLPRLVRFGPVVQEKKSFENRQIRRKKISLAPIFFFQSRKKRDSFVKDHPCIIPVKIGHIWPTSLIKKTFENRPIRKKVASGGHLVFPIHTKSEVLWRSHPCIIPAKFGDIWPSSLRGEDIWNSANQKK